MKQINDFISKFNTSLKLDKNLTIEKNRYFLINPYLKQLVGKEFFYAGVYLGKIKTEKFFPSFPLLAMIAASDEANRITIDEKTEWLFICGRDIFRQGITSIEGSKRKGDYTLILNHQNECLGFGKIIHSLDEVEHGLAIRNISDIGDFLRREK